MVNSIWEKIFLAAVFAFLMFTVVGQLMDFRLVHASPYAYNAGDTFHNLVVAEALKDQGAWKFYPSYYCADYKDCIAFNPPLMPEIAVMLSQWSGLPLWDALFFLITFATIIGILAMFLLIKKHLNSIAAYCSLPLTAFVFLGHGSILFTWGVWNFAIASVFMIALFYFIDEPFYVIILLMGMIHTHTSEFIFAVGFIGLYVLFKRFKNFKEQTINIAAATLLSSYFLWIFYNTWMETTPFRFAVLLAKDSANMYAPTFWMFGYIFGAVILIGMAIVLFSRQINTVTLAGFYMLIIGFTNLIGFNLRAFQTRYFWPVYFAVFLGYPFYLFIKTKKHEWIFPAASMALIVILFTVHSFSTSEGILVRERWDTFGWTEQNTNTTDKILYFYSDDINQASMLFLSERTPYFMQIDELMGWQANMTRYANIRILAEAKSNLAYKDGWEIRHHWDDMNQTDSYIMDLCGFDYYVISAYNQNQALTDIHNNILISLLKHNTQLIYNGNGIKIIRNLEKGEDCIG